MSNLARVHVAYRTLALCALACFCDRAIAGESVRSRLAGRRPNIILILSDDQGYGDLGRNGNPVIKTPNLDRFYDEAVRFEDFHVSPTCSPTRASILAGRHEFKSGVTHTIYERERLSLKAVTLAQVLKSAGYTTGIFGKWHLGDEEPYQPQHRGFDEVFIHGAGGIGQTYPGSCGDAPGNTYFSPVILHNGVFEKTNGYCTDVFFGQAMKWIDSHKGHGPFFCYIPTNAPHQPLQVPEQYENLYAGHLGKYFPARNGKAGSDGPRPAKGDHGQLAPEVASAKFLGMVTNLDENVGRLLAALKEWDIDRDTLVVFLNDNGGTAGCRIFNAGMKGAKATAHNGGTRAMSLWRWPATLRPASVSALTAHVDVFPTLAEIAGAKVPKVTVAKLEGFSLLPLLGNPSAPWHEDRILVAHVGRWAPGTAPTKYGACSVRWQQYLYFPAGGQGELYDLKADPGETRNIAADHPDIVADLSKRYDQWWKDTLPCLVNEQAYKTAPAENPFKALYWKQFQGPGPNNVAREAIPGSRFDSSQEKNLPTAPPRRAKQAAARTDIKDNGCSNGG